MSMEQEFDRDQIIENLRLLSEWLSIKYPGEVIELTVVGGAAMALAGFKNQTRDIDLFGPARLPDPLKAGIRHVSKAKRLPPEWINTSAANVLEKAGKLKILPDYFSEISRTIEVGRNLKVGVLGRQALLSLKLWAASPSYSKHTTDIKSMRPTMGEMKKAVDFVLNIDSTELRRNDLRILLKQMGFNFDEVVGSKTG
jgi:hypothetical protein